MITNDIFLSHLRCRRKAYLKSVGRSGKRHAFEVVQLDLDRAYRKRALTAFLSRHGEDGVVGAQPSLEAALRESPRVVIEAVAEVDGIRSEIHALERVVEPGGSPLTYAPVLFVSNEKVTRQDRLLLAFNALALSAFLGSPSAVGKIVHGAGHRVVRVKLKPLMDEVRQLLAEIRTASAGSDPPRVMLNGHCVECEFRDVCRRQAEAADDLGLLRGMPDKEAEKHRKRGITTVTQLSHTYQPGRRGKRRAGKARKHDQALQALAIREKKVYVMDSPVVPQSGVALYLDIEGIPDIGFEYLFGLLAVKDGVCTEFSFWADHPGQQRTAWVACQQAIEAFGDYTLYHYGKYESRFLDRMKRDAASSEEAAAIERIQGRSCNVLAAIYSHVYFPTWSNGLKDVGNFLGARWSSADASGVQSLAWRLAWESSRDEGTRQQLLAYNREDCHALRRVTEFVLSLGGDQAARADASGPAAAFVEDLQKGGKYRSGKGEFFCPELAHINKCAYSDYQRDKVYLRTSPAMRKSLQRKQLAARKRPKVNENVECGPPEKCPECGKAHLHSTSRRGRKVVSDLKFTSSGVKRWMVRYSALRYKCHLVFLSIYQTCRHKNLSFLQFLRSGQLDIDAFADTSGR